MKKHTPDGCQYDGLNLRFDRRGSIINCKRLMVLGLFTLLFVVLTQSGCAGVISAGSKSPTSPTGTNSAPSITTSLLPNAQLGIQFQESLTATGGLQPYLWSIASGNLPPGITLDTATGMLSGTPSQEGQFDFSAQVRDSSSPTPQTAMKALTLTVLAIAAGPLVCDAAPVPPPASGLTLVCSGTGINQAVTVESSHQFRLVFEAADNWGLSQWYDLVNNPTATTNLALAYGVGGPSQACARESGIPQITFYGDGDKKASMFMAGCGYSTASRSMTILTNTTSQVVLQTVGYPMAGSIDTNVTVTTTYDIRPDGHIYINQKVAVAAAQNLTADNYVLEVGLNDPSGGSASTTTSGWIRASDTQNPVVSGGNPWFQYMFAYWDSSDPNYPNFTKASILLVPGNSARNLWASIGGKILHGWSCGTGCGTQRWGFTTSNADTAFNLPAGGHLSWDWLIVLGTQNSTIMSNFTSSSVAGAIANAYLANPVPPAPIQ